MFQDSNIIFDTPETQQLYLQISEKPVTFNTPLTDQPKFSTTFPMTSTNATINNKDLEIIAHKIERKILAILGTGLVTLGGISIQLYLDLGNRIDSGVAGIHQRLDTTNQRIDNFYQAPAINTP